MTTLRAFYVKMLNLMHYINLNSTNRRYSCHYPIHSRYSTHIPPIMTNVVMVSQTSFQTFTEMNAVFSKFIILKPEIFGT